MSGQRPNISMICPFYNEEDIADLFLTSITTELDKLGRSYEVLCINDGSADNTLNILIQAKTKYPQIRILNLSRNFGKEAALTAGLDLARGDLVIPIDTDLEDPPSLISEMIHLSGQGYDVVLAHRTNRPYDSFFKKKSAGFFYKIHNKISNVQIHENVGDYRLMTRKVVDAVKLLPENQRFMKGIFAWVGFKTASIDYTRAERPAGKTKFSNWRLWNLAIEGVTSFSTVPLSIWLYIGSIMSLLSFLYGSFIIVYTLLTDAVVPGYASVITAVLFLGGIQLIGIGVLGEYIGRVYIETKSRPVYILEGEY